MRTTTSVKSTVEKGIPRNRSTFPEEDKQGDDGKYRLLSHDGTQVWRLNCEESYTLDKGKLDEIRYTEYGDRSGFPVVVSTGFIFKSSTNLLPEEVYGV